MKPTTFKIAGFIGIVLLTVAIVLLVVNPKPEHNLPPQFFTPIIAFEFIRTPQEVQHFFSVKDIPGYEHSMLLGNWIDYGFMLLYSSLSFCIALGIKKLTNANAMYLAMLLCVGMLLGDALENFQIYQIVQHYKNGNITGNLSLLNIFTWTKWSSIASVFFLFAPFFFRGNWFHKIAGALCVSCFALCIAAFIHHGILNEIFASNVVILFLLLVIFAFSYKEKQFISYA